MVPLSERGYLPRGFGLDSLAGLYVGWCTWYTIVTNSPLASSVPPSIASPRRDDGGGADARSYDWCIDTCTVEGRRQSPSRELIRPNQEVNIACPGTSLHPRAKSPAHLSAYM